jgi:hypothetical protein
VLIRRSSHSVVLVGAGEAAVVLDGPAADVWDAFGELATVDDVVRRLSRRYAGVGAALGADVAGFVDDLLEAGLLTPQPAATG